MKDPSAVVQTTYVDSQGITRVGAPVTNPPYHPLPTSIEPREGLPEDMLDLANPQTGAPPDWATPAVAEAPVAEPVATNPPAPDEAALAAAAVAAAQAAGQVDPGTPVAGSLPPQPPVAQPAPATTAEYSGA